MTVPRPALRSGFWVLRCSALGPRFSILGIGYWVLGTGNWELRTGFWVPHCYFRSVVFHYIACNFRFVKATRTARPSRLQRRRQHQLANFLQPVSPCVLTPQHPVPFSLLWLLTSVQTNEPSNERTELALARLEFPFLFPPLSLLAPPIACRSPGPPLRLSARLDWK